MSEGSPLRELAERWLAVDPDPETRAELGELLGDERALAERFGGRLAFGTAGLRGALGAGPLRMNRVLVRSTAAGLGARVRAAGGSRVVIGYDARHKSDLFAVDTAQVLAAQGIECHLFDRPLPTPVLAFAVRRLHADAGVMVTASHNPRADNGFKVYWRDGAQIVPPIDSEIALAIESVGLVSADDLAPADDPRVVSVHDDLVAAYVDAAVGVLDPSSPRDLRVVYTPVHGVGRDVLVAAFARAGFPEPVVVAEQADPDPDFPTAAFPNPEEPGVLDLAVDLARTTGADLVLANDPDADRLAVVVPDGEAWRPLTGNEIGCLLAEHVLARGSGPDRVVATTVVSSRLLSAIAAHHGVHHEETLTGFKWLMRPSVEHSELEYAFGYEEALGYAVGDAVRDKDGISAALAFAELAAEAKAQSGRVLDRLDELHRRHGVHHTGQRSFRFAGPDAQRTMSELMARLRAETPEEVGGSAVFGVTDLLREGTGLPATDALILELEPSTRLVMRPSGTEPKLKLYGEAIVALDGAGLGSARIEAKRRLENALDAMSEMIERAG